MAIYDTEEEQIEALKRWWKDNGQAVIIGVVVGAGLIVGTDLWRNHKKDQNMQASSLYEQLMTADTQGKSEEVDKLAQNLNAQYESTPYAGYAALFQAKTKVQAGDIPAAKAILQKVMISGDERLKNIAKIRMISLMLATGEYEAGLKLIAETDPSSIKGFSSNYEELKGDLYVALNRVDEARTAYENAVRDGAQSPLLQFKLDDLTAAPLKPPALADNAAAPQTTAAPVVSESPVTNPNP